jgi:hypothetical protein
MIAFLEKVLTAHGGTERWLSYNEINVKMRFGGLAFLSKFNRKGLKERTIVISIHEPKVVLHDFPGTGKRGFFTADRVWIESKNGQRLSERLNPRNSFKKTRRKFYWDNLDLLYFTGYASWNYFNSPFLLGRHDVITTEKGPWKENGETWQRIEAIFPDRIPTHCRKQVFYFDELFRMRRLDYDPEVFASWAKAAHYCDEFKLCSGLLMPMQRKVVPRSKNGKSKSKPVLVWIKIKEVTLIN